MNAPRIAVGSLVRGRNHWTGERVDGTVERLEHSDLDGNVYAEVRTNTGLGRAIVADLAPEPIRCRRPATIPSPRNTGGVPQGDGYRCANCGRTVWYIRDGYATGGERLTHDAWVAVQPRHAF